MTLPLILDPTSLTILLAVVARLGYLGASLQQRLRFFATLARPYDDRLAHGCGSTSQDDQAQAEEMNYQQLLAAHGYQESQPLYYANPHQNYPLDVAMSSPVNVPPSQTSASGPTYTMDRQRLLPEQVPQHVVSQSYWTNQISMAYTPSPSQTRKRSHAEESPLDFSSLHLLEPQAGQATLDVPTNLVPDGHTQAGPYSYSFQQQHYQHSQSRSPVPAVHLQPSQQAHMLHNVSAQPQTLQHHHHRLPGHPSPAKQARLGGSTSPAQELEPHTLVGQEGMPEPAPRPKGLKLKFTREDDALLIQLKETKNNLTWKQIAEFFPGRSSGTLQVRYCTKLKAKTTAWSDDMVSSRLSFLQAFASLCVGF